METNALEEFILKNSYYGIDTKEKLDDLRSALISDGYQVSYANTILSPGKFEGEYILVPYFWELYLNGEATSDDETGVWFRLTESESKQWSEEFYHLVTCDNGFITGDFDSPKL